MRERSAPKGTRSRALTPGRSHLVDRSAVRERVQSMMMM